MCKNQALAAIAVLAIASCGEQEKGSTLTDNKAPGEVSTSSADLKQRYFFPRLPARVIAPLLNIDLPRSFHSGADLKTWATSAMAKAAMAEFSLADTQLQMLAFPAFSGRRAVVLLAYASKGNDWRAIYANSDGIDLKAQLQAPFTVARSADGNLVLLSRGEAVGSVEFSYAKEAISSAFK